MSGLIRDGDDVIGAYVSLDEWNRMRGAITELACDPATQPAFAAGLMRGFGMLHHLLLGDDFSKAQHSPLYTTERLKELRATAKKYR